MRNNILIFGVSMFAVNLLFALYAAQESGVAMADVALTSLFQGIILAVMGGAGYLYGLKVVGTSPRFEIILFNAAFSYFFAYAVCSLFGLMQISWLIFAVMVFGASYLAGWRLTGAAE